MKRRKAYRNPIRVAYDTQYGNADSRGIAWRFTFPQWVAWWEQQLGPDWFKLRGVHRYEYCMARFGDEGPYAVWNVECITNAQNCSDRKRLCGEEHPGRRLTAEEVCAIYCSNEPIKMIAQRYKISTGHTAKIKYGLTWSSVTHALGPQRRKLTGQGARTDLL